MKKMTKEKQKTVEETQALAFHKALLLTKEKQKTVEETQEILFDTFLLHV